MLLRSKTLAYVEKLAPLSDPSLVVPTICPDTCPQRDARAIAARPLECIPRIRTHVFGTLAHNLLNTPRNGSLAGHMLPRSIHEHQFPCGHERFEQLFYKKGIALREGGERVEKISISSPLP